MGEPWRIGVLGVGGGGGDEGANLGKVYQTISKIWENRKKSPIFTYNGKFSVGKPNLTMNFL